jgi:hypothetical protein
LAEQAHVVMGGGDAVLVVEHGAAQKVTGSV